MPTKTKTRLPAASPASNFRPEYLHLPAIGGDPICGLSRSSWYDLEARGLIRLVRVRKPGAQRGRTLLPVPQAIALVKRLGAQAAKAVAA